MDVEFFGRGKRRHPDELILSIHATGGRLVVRCCTSIMQAALSSAAVAQECEAAAADTTVALSGDLRQQQHGHSYTGAETFLVGISPTFWAHVPLMIRQLHNLKLMDGIHCLLLVDQNNNQQQQVVVSSMDDERISSPPRVIPISKCKLVGTIVCSERRANGCILYVIDDGTGLVDCLHWDNDNDDDDDNGLLPSLTGRTSTGRSNDMLLPAGTLVRVMGRIQCVAVGDVVETVCVQATGDVGGGGGNTKNNVKAWCRVNAAVREIHASLLEPVTNNYRSRATPLSMDRESQHWLDCVRCIEQHQQIPISATSAPPFSASSLSLTGDGDPQLPLLKLNNALDILKVLGPEIASQVADQGNLPSADDTLGTWRLFGTRCTCAGNGSNSKTATSTIAIHQDLLYCHCIATPVVEDPDYRYRDRLLEKLLQAEQREAAAAVALPPLQENGADGDNEETTSYEDHAFHLRFQYRTVVTDEELNQIAAQQQQHISRSNKNSTAIIKRQSANHHHGQDVQQLIRNTFQALRKDGILYLLDADSDTYLLLSRKGVLEPYIRRSLLLAKNNAAARTRFHAARRPAYLDAVPRARMQLVRRSVVLLNNKNK